MKKSHFVFIFAFFAVIMLGSCGNRSGKENPDSGIEATKVQYTCPMHPEVIDNNPGACPKCGMDLVEKV